MSELKQKTISGLTWSIVERFSSQGLQFIFTLVIARLLQPSDFGLVGMITIFIAVSYSIIDSGFSSALIQKKDRNQTDLSTVFFFNFGISILSYILIVIFSPLIADFYNEQKLILLTKVVSINIIIMSLSIIQTTIYSINLNFRTQAKASITSTVISGIIGIALAYYGFGVWSLVWQTTIKNILNVILLWVYSNWRPTLCFSKKSFASLLPFGSKLLLAGLLYTFFENIYLVIIGKYFNSKELGYYVRAKTISNLPSTVLTTIILRVTYPILSSIQDDEIRLISGYNKIFRFTIYITFPLIILLAVIAKPLVLMLLTDKWSGAIFFLKLLCFVMIWFPLNEIDVNILKVKAQSNIILKLAIFRIVVTVIILLITIPFGLNIIVIGQIISALMTFLIIHIYTNRIIKIHPKGQLIDILHFLTIILLIAFITNFVNGIILLNFVKIILEVILFMSLYIIYSKFFFKEELKEILLVLNNKINRS